MKMISLMTPTHNEYFLPYVSSPLTAPPITLEPGYYGPPHVPVPFLPETPFLAQYQDDDDIPTAPPKSHRLSAPDPITFHDNSHRNHRRIRSLEHPRLSWLRLPPGLSGADVEDEHQFPSLLLWKKRKVISANVRRSSFTAPPYDEISEEWPQISDSTHARILRSLPLEESPFYDEAHIPVHLPVHRPTSPVPWEVKRRKGPQLRFQNTDLEEEEVDGYEGECNDKRGILIGCFNISIPIPKPHVSFPMFSKKKPDPLSPALRSLVEKPITPEEYHSYFVNLYLNNQPALG